MDSEPRGLTPGDKVASGIGLVVGLVTLPAWVANAATFPWLGAGIFMRNSLGFWLAAVTLSVVALARSGRYRRLPRPAEWLALTLFAWGAAGMLPPASHEGLTTVILWPLTPLNLRHETGRWVACGLVAVLILLGCLIGRATRSVLPVPVRVAWLTFLVFVAIWSPLTTLGLHAADWFAPADGFGRGDTMVLYRGACQWLAQTPLALMVGWPAVATVAGRLRGEPWTWLETAAATAAGVAGLLALVVCRGEFSPFSLPGLGERAIALAWLVLVAVLDLQLVRWARHADRPEIDLGVIADIPGRPGAARPAAGATRP